MSLDHALPETSGEADTFEHFLTAIVLTRCLDNADRHSSRAGDIEGLIERLSCVLRSAAQTVTAGRRDHSNSLPRHKVSAVAAHVIDNLDRPIRVADLAAIANVSPHHFSRQFRAATGLAPHQYVSHCRMRRAAQLLIDSEMSVCSVAIEVGCVDQSHFANTFRRTFGCTPREFQRSGRRPREAAVSRHQATRGAHTERGDAVINDGPFPDGANAHERAAALLSCAQRCGPGERSSAREGGRLRFDRPFTSTREQP
jgi:AraC-like DNA-binding protein